jgi:branched-chain amino acid transport system permease protein
VTLTSIPAKLAATRRRLDDRRSVLVGLAGIVLVLFWVGDNGYRQSLWMVGCTYALIALGMYVPFVLSGSLSMAYGAYAAIGGYSVAIVANDHGLPLWVGWLVAPPISAVVALVLGWATRRLSGFYLVAVTLLFANAFIAWVRTSESVTGGEGGISGLPRLDLLGWDLTALQRTILSGMTVLVVAFLLDRLRLSRWGIMVRTMREVPHAAEAVGVRVPTLQLVALALGAMIGSLAGALFTSQLGNVSPDTFGLHLVFLAVFMPIIGGLGTPWGAVLGAGIVAHLTLNVELFAESGTLLVAVGVLIILLIAPRGVAGLIDQMRKRAGELVATTSGATRG